MKKKDSRFCIFHRPPLETRGMHLNTLQARQALDDLCERRAWVAADNEAAAPLSGAELCQLLEASTSGNMMHAHLEDFEHEATLLVVAPIVRASKQSEQSDVTILRDVLQLMIESIKGSLVHCVLFFSDNCASAQLRQIQDVATSSGSTRFTACNTCFLCIPVLRHPLNQDKQYELLARDKVGMTLEIECAEIDLHQTMPRNVFINHKHLGGNKWLLQTMSMSSDRYEREAKAWLQTSGVNVVREHAESEYHGVVKELLNGDPSRISDLPHMLLSDPCNIVMGGKTGDMVRIRRFSEDGNVAYRVIS